MITNFWTFQRKELVSNLLRGQDIVPDLARSITEYPSREFAYSYLLTAYCNRFFAEVNGLVFGFIGSSRVPDVKSATMFWRMIEEAGEPSGSTFSPETHNLLHVQVSEDIPILTCDFYRFSDLIYAGMQEDRYPEKFMQYAIRDLLKPNGPNDSWELVVGHIPYIKASWNYMVNPAYRQEAF